MESVDYGDTEYRYEMEGNKNYSQEGESFDGYQTQEFSRDGELETIEDEAAADEEDYYDSEEYADDVEYEDSTN